MEKTILTTLQEILPLELTTGNQGIEGQLFIESINQLKIENDTLSVKGVLQGTNLSVITKIADQNIRLKIGRVSVPISGHLQTVFDKKKKILFITPRFDHQANGALQPLLTALELKTFQVPLDAIQLLDIKAGNRTFPLQMTITDIAGMDNNLIFKMRPSLGTP